MSERFRGKVVIVTGAGSGIGRATALAFAREGAAVGVADRSQPKADAVAAEAKALGARALALACDVSQAGDCEAAVRAAEAALGPLDILVNNAGVGTTGTVLTTDEAEFDRLMAVNVKGTYLMSRAALAVMVPRRRGAIVNAGSIAGMRAVADRAAYVTTKFAVVGLTKAMALDHVKDGIRVNAVCPGTTLTPWIDERLGGGPGPRRGDGHPGGTTADGPSRHGRGDGRGLPVPGLGRVLVHHRQHARRRRWLHLLRPPGR